MKYFPGLGGWVRFGSWNQSVANFKRSVLPPLEIVETVEQFELDILDLIAGVGVDLRVGTEFRPIEFASFAFLRICVVRFAVEQKVGPASHPQKRFSVAANFHFIRRIAA